MRRYILFFTFVCLIQNSCYSQLDIKQLQKHKELTIQDILDLNLQILSTQLSCGAYSIPDMGRIDTPVSIELSKDLIIKFNIEGELPEKISTQDTMEIVKETMEILFVAIRELLYSKFPELNFDPQSCIVGYWTHMDTPERIAIWEKGHVKLIH